MQFEITVHETQMKTKKIYYIMFNDLYVYMNYNLKGERSFKFRDSNLIISNDYHFYDTLEEAKWVIEKLLESDIRPKSLIDLI